MDEKAQIYARLTALGLRYERAGHARAETMEDLAGVMRLLDCVIPKNLFLTPRNQSAFYLCLTMPNAAFRTADISKQIGSARLSFGPEDRLMQYLRTYPGAISPMGLIFDEPRAVNLLVDERLFPLPRLGFHPNDNRETLVLSGCDFFEVFLPSTGHAPRGVILSNPPNLQF